ncbi:MAG: RNA-binding domain-containing protein [Candidatus Margulisiibacteriota bacterium]
MSWNTILDLLGEGESQHLFFLKKADSEILLAQHIAALANTEGGKIVIGLDNANGHLIGCTHDRDWFLITAREYCSPSVNINISVIPRHEHNIIMLDIPEGDDKPYMVDDRCYVREENITRIAKSNEEKIIKGYEGNKNINTRQKKALSYIQDHNVITNREYRDLFGVSHKTAHIELTDMVNQSMLEIHGSGRSTSYIMAGEPAMKQTDSISEYQNESQIAPPETPLTPILPLVEIEETNKDIEQNIPSGDIFNEQANLLEDLEYPEEFPSQLEINGSYIR